MIAARWERPRRTLCPVLSLLAPRSRSARTAVVAGAVVLQLVAGLVAATVVDDATTTAPAGSTTRARSVPQAGDVGDAVRDAEEQRAAAVSRLLDTRAAAVLGRDRDAFLATVDPRAAAFRARQAALFDALAQVPLGTWEYALGAGTGQPPDSQLDTRYGREQWWAPDVSLSYTLAGFDERPVIADHHLTFVRTSGRWLLGADDDFAAVGLATPRALWDRGPVVAVRAKGVLVLGHADTPKLLRNVAAVAADAIPRVTAVWGAWSQRAVVVVPSSGDEMSELLGSTGDLSQIAAVATAELRGGTDEYDPAGDRILVNPQTFPKLGQLGRRVVLTHEITHVATRRASGPAVPAWLAEGFADYIGYLDVDVPLAVSARDLRRDVRAGKAPTALPVENDFDGANEGLPAAYEAAWLAVRLLAREHGRAGLLELYRAVGASRGVPSAQAVETALREQLGTSTDELTADWRAYLQQQLG